MIDDLHGILAGSFEVFLKLAGLFLEYLKVLAWPVVVFTLAMIFRRPLIRLMERLRKAAAGGVSVELADDAHELVKDAIETVAEVPKVGGDASSTPRPDEKPNHEVEAAAIPSDPPTSPADPPEFEQLAPTWIEEWEHHKKVRDDGEPKETGSNYNLADILTAWQGLELRARRLGALIGMPVERWSVYRLVDTLADRRYVPIALSDITRRLTRLRNRIVHAEEPPTNAIASDFRATARLIDSALIDAEDRIRIDQIVNETESDEGSER